MKKKLTAVLTVIAMVLTLLPFGAVPAFAATTVMVNRVTLEEGRTYGEGGTPIDGLTGGSLVLNGTTLTLNGANIVATDTNGIQVSENLTLSSMGASTITAQGGINIADGYTLTVDSPNGDITVTNIRDGYEGIYGDVTVSGGILNASGGRITGNGINGDVTVSAGTLNASGGTNGGVGISGNVTVSSGIVNATGGTSGGDGISGDVSISGGKLNATGIDHSSGIYGSVNATDGELVTKGGDSATGDGGYGISATLGSTISISDTAKVTALGGEGSSYGGHGIYIYNDTEVGDDISVSGGTLIAKGGTGTSGTAHGIDVNTIPAGSATNMVVTGGKVVAIAGTGGIGISNKPSVTATASSVAVVQTAEGADGDYNPTGTVTPVTNYATEDYNTANYVSIEFENRYPVTVAGVQVTEHNKDNVLGDGEVVYTPAEGGNSAKLTLNGANIVATGTNYGLDVSENLTLSSTGASTITGALHGISIAAGYTLTVNTTEDITVNGGNVNGSHGINGTVSVSAGTVNANGGTNSGHGIIGDVSVSGGTLNATGGTSGGIGIFGNVSISGGKLNATGVDSRTGIDGGVNATDGELIAKGGDSATERGGYGIFATFGNTISISGTAEVTAIGGDSSISNGGHGIYIYNDTEVGDDISVSGGTLIAKGGDGTSGTAHGIYVNTAVAGSATNMVVTGGKVVAIAGTGGMGISTKPSVTATPPSVALVQTAMGANADYTPSGSLTLITDIDVAAYNEASYVSIEILDTVTVTNNLTNITSDNNITQIVKPVVNNYTATLSVASGYMLPETIEVSVGGTPLTAGADYNYDKQSGELSIPMAKITGDISITARGIQILVFTQGENATVQQGSELRAVVDAPFIEYLESKVDGNVIHASDTGDNANASVVESSIALTLSGTYTASLAPGTYSLEIVTESGFARTNFTVLAQGEPIVPPVEPTTPSEGVSTQQGSPTTGDSTGLLWLALAMAVAGVGAVVARKKVTDK